MGAAMMAQPEYAFTAEFPCDRFCHVEVDMTAMHLGVTHRQLQAAAGLEHERKHPEIRPAKPPKAARPGTPIHDGVQASFQAPFTS